MVFDAAAVPEPIVDALVAWVRESAPPPAATTIDVDGVLVDLIAVWRALADFEEVRMSVAEKRTAALVGTIAGLSAKEIADRLHTTRRNVQRYRQELRACLDLEGAVLVRIRSTKPEFWRSRRIGSVSWDARLFLKGLEHYVDDNGVGKDDLALIVGDLFQRDLVREPSRTLARSSEAISELHEGGLLWRYEVDGTALLYLSFWDSVQRIDKPQKGRFPRPDGTMNYKESEIRECIAKPREESRTFAPGTGEQGNRGTGTPPAPPAEPAAEDPDVDVVDDSEAGVHSTDIDIAEPVTAQTIVATLIDECQRVGIKLPKQIIGQYAKRIKTHLDEGYTPGQIWAALVLMANDRVLNRPSLLTNKLVTVQHGPERAPVRERRSATDESVEGWLAMADGFGEEAA